MTDHAPAFLLWMKLTDSKSFDSLMRLGMDYVDPHAAFSDPELLTPCPGPALPGLPDHSFPVTDVKRETVPARMRPIEKSSLH